MRDGHDALRAFLSELHSQTQYLQGAHPQPARPDFFARQSNPWARKEFLQTEPPPLAVPAPSAAIEVGQHGGTDGDELRKLRLRCKHAA